MNYILHDLNFFQAKNLFWFVYKANIRFRIFFRNQTESFEKSQMFVMKMILLSELLTEDLFENHATYLPAKFAKSYISCTLSYPLMYGTTVEKQGGGRGSPKCQ